MMHSYCRFPFTIVTHSPSPTTFLSTSTSIKRFSKRLSTHAFHCSAALGAVHDPPEPAQQHELKEQNSDPEVVALGKAAARKAKRQPPSIIWPAISAGFSELQALLNNGALLIDKPLEWTSFDVCGKLRGTLKPWKVKKVGHAGTLDPMASGLLIVCTGAGTKFVEDFQSMEKEYSGVLRLGEGTPSYDGETEVNERLTWEHVTDDDLQLVAKQFEGDILQLPPMYSAIKVKGQRLYELARDGQSIKREERPVSIQSLQLWRSDDGPEIVLASSPKSDIGAGNNSSKSSDNKTSSIDGEHIEASSSGSSSNMTGSTEASSNRSCIDSTRPNNRSCTEDSSNTGMTSSSCCCGNSGKIGGSRFSRPGIEDNGGRSFCQGSMVGHHRPRQDVYFRVRCSKGTYVRSLVYDVGRALGTVAYMASLRREANGDFHIRDAWQLNDLVDHLWRVWNEARAAEENEQGQVEVEPSN